MKKLSKDSIRYIIYFIVFILLSLLIFRVKIVKDMIYLVFISFIVAYVLKPLNERLIKMGMNRRFSSVLLILMLILIFVLSITFLIPILFRESANISDAIYNIEMFINGFYEKVKPLSNNKFFYNLLQNIYGRINTTFDNAFNNAFERVLKLGENLLSFAIVPMIVYYFLADAKDISNRLFTLFPVKSRYIIRKIFRDIDKILGRYLATQVILSIIVGILTFIVLLVLKVDFPLILSVLNAFFNIIPYFGPLLGALPGVIVAFLKSPTIALWTAIWLYLIQQVEGNIISPKFIGDNISMHPLVVILILVIGGKLWGFFGMVLAVPIGVIIKVIYEDFNYYIF
ncbi:AI-2 transport protein TqsA [Clostridium liquoris]|jgi:predicted PurR-regulated permease PerM|uniref:AI-2 transport protein TqsA n=1 Tax=Clostridium liquoris TaxID=1289519 RepID=A0A2T0B0G6_9CLOT|nr:AI-2E family transporter [Clostridium liquoris]PRR77025.1 AI-2 transport protein TqsA [Clostridium liquoris]